jgi:hypothetical protein
VLTRLFRSACLSGFVICVPVTAVAQVQTANIGLHAVGAIGIQGGFARLERSSKGQEGGLLLDVGWLRGQSLRLQTEISVLRASLTEYVEIEDSTFRGDYYDLSGSLTALWLTSHNSKVSPYALAGISVHALSSAFQTAVLDQRYNANRFGSQIGAGIRLRLGDSRQALFFEGRRIIADQVDRTVWRAGALVLLGDLYR